jgi:hypothetical protein
MKILLLGEFSGLHKNIKEGLIDCGHEVVVAGYSDGFKKIPTDISFESYLPSILGRVHKKIKPYFMADKMKDFDVVQLINPFLFYSKYYQSENLITKIKDNNNKIFLSGAGDDAYFWKYGRERLRYGPFSDFLKYDLKSNRYFMENEKSMIFNDKIISLCNGIIPIMYEYEVSYLEHRKRLSTIPIAINTDKVEYKENQIQKKIVIFHGLNRYGFKGTRHVEEAFQYLAKKYPSDLELIIDGGLPLDKYLKIMEKTNVVIDQVNTYSLGVNGVYALAMGKIVLGGAEPESLKSIGVNDSPVINIKPNAKSIIEEVEKLIDIRHNFVELGKYSRAFSERVHGHKIIAKKYIETWSKN